MSASLRDLENALDAMARAYRDAFGDTPTVVAVPPDKMARAAALLRRAVQTNIPFESDREWFAALGMRLPPPGSLI